MTNTANEAAYRKLRQVLGPDEANRIIASTLEQLGVEQLQTADDRLGFSLQLIRRGGILEIIGRAIKIQALMQGAKE